MKLTEVFDFGDLKDSVGRISETLIKIAADLCIEVGWSHSKGSSEFLEHTPIYTTALIDVMNSTFGFPC